VLFLRFAHILVAIIAIGATLTYTLWLRIGERHPEHLAYTIRGIRTIDRRVANPAYGLLLVTGLAMVLVGGIPLAQAWLLTALVLYAAAALVGYFVFGPVVKRELAALERGGVTDPDYLRYRGQARQLAIITITAVLVIFALMVMKPF